MVGPRLNKLHVMLEGRGQVVNDPLGANNDNQVLISNLKRVSYSQVIVLGVHIFESTLICSNPFKTTMGVVRLVQPGDFVRVELCKE